MRCYTREEIRENAKQGDLQDAWVKHSDHIQEMKELAQKVVARVKEELDSNGHDLKEEITRFGDVDYY